VIPPHVTHVPCDLDQQRKRREARRDSVARAVAWRNGKRSLLDRMLRLGAPVGQLAAEDLRHGEAEDVLHALRF
jgi:hypothetical protein